MDDEPPTPPTEPTEEEWPGSDDEPLPIEGGYTQATVRPVLTYEEYLRVAQQLFDNGIATWDIDAVKILANHNTMPNPAVLDVWARSVTSSADAGPAPESAKLVVQFGKFKREVLQESGKRMLKQLTLMELQRAITKVLTENYPPQCLTESQQMRVQSFEGRLKHDHDRATSAPPKKKTEKTKEPLLPASTAVEPEKQPEPEPEPEPEKQPAPALGAAALGAQAVGTHAVGTHAVGTPVVLDPRQVQVAISNGLVGAFYVLVGTGIVGGWFAARSWYRRGWDEKAERLSDLCDALIAQLKDK